MRCVNIDWLEVSCEEDNNRFPCNADYFREQGYFVVERDYGTRIWSEVFTIEDMEGHPWLEVRRNPPSGRSSFTGLTDQSCRLRLVNAQCYVTNCVERLRQFLVKHGYIFKKIFRIDIAYDFEKFDTGDNPARFARRYIEGKYRKINQAKLQAIGKDNWSMFDWQSLSWGSHTSMVSTKMYNKSLEIESVSRDKVYIKLAWFQAGLVDDPINFTKMGEDGKPYTPEIWRVEFSLRSKAERWLVIEDQSGKRMKKKKVPHTLSLFDSPDKLWQRFQDLAYHYFRFKKLEYKSGKSATIAEIDTDTQKKPEKELKRKDLCADKKLFKFDADREFLHIDNCVDARKPDNDLLILKRRLIRYKNLHLNPDVKKACDVLIEIVSREDMSRYTPRQIFSEVEALKIAISMKIKHPSIDILETVTKIQHDLFNDEMF